MSEIVYKVVRREHYGLYSVYSKHSWRVRYERGVPTSGIGGTPVFAFETYGFAWSMVNKLSNSIGELEVWEAEAPECTPINLVPCGMRLTWSAFWHNREYFRAPTVLAPLGTVICPEITLIRKCWSRW